MKNNKTQSFFTKTIAFIALIGFCITSNQKVFANSPFYLSKLEKHFILERSNYIIYEDTSRTISIKDIINTPNKHLISDANYYQNLNADYIVEYVFINDTKESGKWVIELIDPHIDSLEFQQKGVISIQKQGFTIPFNYRVYQHKNHVFDINILPGDTARCYVKLHSKSHVAFNTKIQTNAYFSKYSLSEYFYLGLFYGFLIIMAFYNVILYFFTKMRTRLYYTLYVVSCILSSLTEDGLGFQFIWGSFPEINNWLADIQPVIYLTFYIIYSLSFLDISHQSKKFKTILIIVLGVYSMVHLLCIYFNLIPKYWLPTYFVPFVLIWAFSLKKYLLGIRSMRFLLLGSSLILISYIIFYTRMLGIVENSIFVVYFFNFAVTVEILLFSIAMGDKLRAIQFENLKDKELVIEGLKENEALSNKVNRELEEKVSERTKDLHKAKILLEQQAKEITEMNLKLDLSNRSLSKKVVEVSKKRVHGEAINPEEFHELYPNKLECFKLLEEIKWKNGFNCRKCKGTNFTNGSAFRSKRCTKCGTNETPTANTIFHGLRISIDKAFYIFALTVQSKGEISSIDLEKKTGVNQKACWSFKQKIKERMSDPKKENSSWDKLIF